jgi:hypothetical protein
MDISYQRGVNIWQAGYMRRATFICMVKMILGIEVMEQKRFSCRGDAYKAGYFKGGINRERL